MEKSKLINVIQNAKKIAIFSHVNPDADALCSACAFKNIIRNNFVFKGIDVFVDGEIGELYDPILRNEVVNPLPYSSYDLAIVLDCPNPSRVGKYEELLSSIPFTINIDHHSTNTRFGNINYVSNKVSSTCELLYLISKNICNFELNNVIAKELYQGIITDTNCFTSLSLTKLSHKVLNELLEYKFDADVIKEYYFKNNTQEKTKLLAKSLSGIKYYQDGTVAVMKIPYEDFLKCNATFEDTLGIVDSGAAINGVKVCAILIEKMPQKIYVSLRGKGEINVGEIAKHFNGGGNETTAAFQYEGEMRELEKSFSTYLKGEVKDLPKDQDDIRIF